MFENIGNKIKKLATIICCIGMVFSMVYGGIRCVNGADISDKKLIASGVLFIIIGCLVSWISVFLLYGFGELIDKTCSIERMLADSQREKQYFDQQISGTASGLTENEEDKTI